MINPGDARLLIVDDMEDMRNILCQLLRAMGYDRLSLARNGEQAWILLQTLPFDGVLCDWNMPKMSGRALLEKVRAEPHLRHLPFVMITGENTAERVESAVNGGVTDFIVKPFTAALLESRLRLMLSRQRQRQRP